MKTASEGLIEAAGEVVGKGRYRVRLANVGNPDFRQDSRYALPGTVCGWARVESLQACSDVCRHYISYCDLGGGNWTGGQIEDTATGAIIGRVSYNGRVWGTDGKEIAL